MSERSPIIVVDQLGTYNEAELKDLSQSSQAVHGGANPIDRGVLHNAGNQAESAAHATLSTQTFRGDLLRASTTELYDVAKSLQGEHDRPGLWTKEQNAAIEYLKRPLPKSRHNMDSRRGRMGYFVESHKISPEQTKAFIGNLGRIAVEPIIALHKTSREFANTVQPKLREASKTTLRHAKGAVRRGLELDAEFVGRGAELDRKIGVLLLAEIQKHDLVEKAKKAPRHAKKQALKFGDWLDAK